MKRASQLFMPLWGGNSQGRLIEFPRLMISGLGGKLPDVPISSPNHQGTIYINRTKQEKSLTNTSVKATLCGRGKPGETGKTLQAEQQQGQVSRCASAAPTCTTLGSTAPTTVLIQFVGAPGRAITFHVTGYCLCILHTSRTGLCSLQHGQVAQLNP